MNAVHYTETRKHILHDKGDGTEVKRREPWSSNFSFFKKISDDSECEMSLSQKEKKETNRTRSPWIKITTHSAAPAITTLLS